MTSMWELNVGTSRKYVGQRRDNDNDSGILASYNNNTFRERGQKGLSIEQQHIIINFLDKINIKKKKWTSEYIPDCV